MSYRHSIRVYWEDTDAGGVVFYANYLKFFERARTEWLRSLGFEQQRMRDKDGWMFVVTDTRVRYLRPARLDDVLEVDAVLVERSPARLTLRQHARHAGHVLAEGDITIACVGAETFRPRRIPNELLQAIT